MNILKGMKITVLGIALICQFQTGYSGTPLPAPVGRVVWIKGTSLKAVMPNKEQRLLQKLSIIYLHDVLMTDDKTQAEIVFTDNTLITFKPGTQFSIDQYTFNANAKAKKGSVGKYIMSLVAGGFRTITGLIAKSNPIDYQVNTPVATIGVRGTDYVVQIHNGQVYLGYYTGKPCITSKKSATELCLDAKTPYAYVPTATSAPQPLTQQPDFFKEQLQITPASIAFTTTTGTAGGPRPNGPISSFCISY